MERFAMVDIALYTSLLYIMCIQKEDINETY